MVSKSELEKIQELKREGTSIGTFLYHIDEFIEDPERVKVLSTRFRALLANEMVLLRIRDVKIRQELEDLGWRGPGVGARKWVKK